MNRAKVAIIDDHDDGRHLMSIVLSKWYEVSSYRDGPSGVKGLHDDCPDVVLIDGRISILKAMRSDPILCNLPTIAVTAYAMPSDKERFLAAGFDDYIAKPYDVEALRFAIEAQLKKKARGISN